MQRFANPTIFMAISGAVLPWLAVLTAGLFAVGLYMSFFTAPPDYQQGETVRIMFIHVPCAWLAMMCYSIIAISSFGFLVFRHPLADVSAKAAAPLGAMFTLLALVTGSLWGKPMWGAYWAWDARMTSVLILFFLYIGLIALRLAIEDELQGGKLTAVLSLLGIVILPIIKFSVDWWNTLHQPASVIKLGGSTIDKSMLWPLLVMAGAFTLLFFVLHLASMRNEIRRRRILATRLAAVRRASPAMSKTMSKAGRAQPAE